MNLNRTPLAALLTLALAADSAQGAEQSLTYGAWGRQVTVRFAAEGIEAGPRSYTHTTDLLLRPGDAQAVHYQEDATLPRVRSGNLAFDALFAMAGAEMRQNAVAAIRDDSYNGGQPIACECFETGEKWHYVWTRDLSYAADLGLALLAPERVRNSLLFKLSGYRPGVAKAAQVPGSEDGLQIVQDTGSGGSWPVSTDRVTWAFGADQALKTLAPAQRAEFAATALKALANTIEIDRVAAFDALAGLYNGEQSFLDWREQSYAGWIPGDLPFMASSKALSTNVAHYKALTLAAMLAREAGDNGNAQRWEGWAVKLKDAINARFWLKDAGMYSSLTAGHFDGAALHKFDWLGQSLAIVAGIADPEQARSILARYPHGPMGAPVIWPQQPGQAVYHNRAMWPFVTAYGLRAAIAGTNVAVADAAYNTLLRGAAIGGSNMENLEWLTGQPLLEHPGQQALDGPVVNSRRQLWSVGGYLGAIVGGVFGVEATHDGLAVKPFITARLRGEMLGNSNTITLSNLTVRGKRLTVQVKLPPVARTDGWFPVQGIALNGKDTPFPVKWDQLPEDSSIVVTLGELEPGRQDITRVTAEPLAKDSKVFAPPDPVIAGVARTGARAVLTFGELAAGSTLTVYRDGKQVASKLTARSWTDAGAGDAACYAVEATFTASGNRSHHSAPACIGETIAVPAVPALKDWGAAGDRFTSDIVVPRAGTWQVQLHYRNNAHQVNLGISGGVKWLQVQDGTGKTVAQGVVQLPHSAAGKALYSTPLAATLAPGRYVARVLDFTNMSYLASNATYKDAGGAAGPSNRVDLLGLRLLRTNAGTVANPPIARGTLEIIEKFRSPQLNNERSLRVYLPPSYAANPQRRYPVLYVHDGQNQFDQKTAYSTEWHLDEVADRLVANGAMREVIVVGIDNTPERLAEYAPCCDPGWGGGKLGEYGAFVADTVKPWIDARYRTLPGRADTAIMGSSLGGIASQQIAQRYPHVFGQAAALSGSWWWNNGTLVANPPQVDKQHPVRLYVDVGTAMDGIEATRDFRAALLKQGYREGKDLLYYEDAGGTHSEAAWASRAYRPLTWFFPAKKSTQ